MNEFQIGPVPGQMGIHTQVAVNLLKKGNVGDMIDVTQMSEAMGRDCSSNGDGRGNVSTALKVVERDYKITWDWDRVSKAWFCCDHHQRLLKTDSYKRRSRSTVSRGLITAATVDVSQLSVEDRMKHNLTTTQMLLSANVFTNQFQNKLKGITSDPQLPEERKLIELMKRKPE